MITVTITDKEPNEVLEIVHQLRREGMIQGQDFDFAFKQSQWDEMIGEIPKHADFMFHTEQLASWFSLKWLA
jgi:hypothetical protein